MTKSDLNARLPYTPRASSRTTWPMSSSITRRRIESTIEWSWVAMRTVVPVRLIRSSSSMMSWLVSGSRLPVGSSASSSIGRLTNARAIATRCCSPRRARWAAGRPCRRARRGRAPRAPPCGSWRGLADHLEGERDVLADRLVRQQPEVLEHAADALPQPRDPAARQLGDVEVGHGDGARVGTSSRSSSRRNVDLPDPDGPMRKTNSPLSIDAETRSSAGRVEVLYVLVTRSRRITAAEATRPALSNRDPTRPLGDRRLPLPDQAAWLRRQRMPASMKPSMSPSSTAVGLPTSYSVRRSFTIW